MGQQTFTIEGIIHKIMPRETRGKYEVQTFVLEVPGYNERVELAKFELFGDKCDRIDAFQEGDPAVVGFNLTGRENKGNFYTNLSAWRVTRPDHPNQHGNRTDNRRNNKEHQKQSSYRDYKLEDRCKSGRRTDSERLRNPEPAGRMDDDDIEF